MADATAIASTRTSRILISAGYGTIRTTARLFAGLRVPPAVEARHGGLPGLHPAVVGLGVH